MRRNRIVNVRLNGDRNKTINHVLSKCIKLAQIEYNTRHNWVGKVINWELRKKFKFDHTNKWYMHNPESVPENEMHKLLREFKIQTDHLISARRSNLLIGNNNNNKKEKKKENLPNSGP